LTVIDGRVLAPARPCEVDDDRFLLFAIADQGCDQAIFRVPRRHTMTSVPNSQSTDGIPTYTKGADPDGRYADYYPAWLENLADDVTIEGSLLDGAALGPEAVRTIIGAIRTLYEHQQFNFAGAYGENGWLEDYTAHVRGEPIGCAVLVTKNAAGKTQHVAANYRPRSSLLLLSRLVGEKVVGTPYAKYFMAGES
jgi:hypothetical protein